jgi:hypothetical protein
MNSLVSVRTNLMYAKKKKKDAKDQDEYVRQQELIFLIEKPTYKYSNEGEVIREKSLEEMRFSLPVEGIEQLIKLLTRLKDLNEEDLV